MLVIKEISSQFHSCCSSSQRSAYLLLRGPLLNTIAIIYAAQLGYTALSVVALAIAWQNLFGNYIIIALCAPFSNLHLYIPNPLPCFQAELITSLLSTVCISLVWLAAEDILSLFVNHSLSCDVAQFVYISIPAFISNHAIRAIEKSLHNTTSMPLRISTIIVCLYIFLLLLLPTSVLTLAITSTVLSVLHLFALLLTNRLYPLPPLSLPSLYSYLQYLPGALVLSYSGAIIDVSISVAIITYSYPSLAIFFSLHSCLLSLVRPLQLSASSSIIRHMAQHHTYLARLTAHTAITTGTLLSLLSGAIIAVIVIFHPEIVTSHDALQRDITHNMYNFPLLCFISGWCHSLLNILKTTFKDRLLLPLFICIDTTTIVLVCIAYFYGSLHPASLILVYITRTLSLTILCNVIVARINWLLEVNHRTWQRISTTEEPILLDITYMVYAHDDDEHLPPSVYETSWFGAVQAMLGVPSRQIEYESVQLIADAFDDTDNAEVEV